MSEPILEIDRVGKVFVQPLDLAARLANLLGADLRASIVRALDDVRLSVHAGEVVALVGEFGLRQVHARPHRRPACWRRAAGRCGSAGDPSMRWPSAAARSPCR